MSDTAGLKLNGNPTTSYTTAIGEKRLADGSYVSLNTDTKIVVGYSNSKRHVHYRM